MFLFNIFDCLKNEVEDPVVYLKSPFWDFRVGPGSETKLNTIMTQLLILPKGKIIFAWFFMVAHSPRLVWSKR